MTSVKKSALFCFWAMAFTLPFSTAFAMVFSLLGLFISITFLGVHLAIAHPLSIKPIIEDKLSQACIALFLWTLLTAFWSVAPPNELLEGIAKYRKLVYVPLVAIILLNFRADNDFLVKAFFWGCVFSAFGSLGSIFSVYDYLPFSRNELGGWSLSIGQKHQNIFTIGPGSSPTFGRAYISQSLFHLVAVCYAVVNLSERQTSGSVGKLRTLFYILSLPLLTYVSISLGSRTGYLLFSILIIIVGIRIFIAIRRPVISLQPAQIMFMGAACFAVLANWSHIALRTGDMVNEIQAYHATSFSGVDREVVTSGALRSQFWVSGLQMISQSPLVGHGIASYAELFETSNQPFKEFTGRTQPHSEILIQFINGGAVSFLIYVCIFWLMVRHLIPQLFGRGNSNQEAGIMFYVSASSVMFFASSIFNSVIFDFAEGHLFVILASTLVLYQARSSRKEI